MYMYYFYLLGYYLFFGLTWIQEKGLEGSRYCYELCYEKIKVVEIDDEGSPVRKRRFRTFDNRGNIVDFRFSK